MRILVTGSSGFIGSAIASALSRAGYQVRAASRRRTAVAELPGVHWVQLPDLKEDFEWAPFLADVDVVVHLAGIAHRSLSEAPDYEKVNRAATGRLARASAESRIKRLVFISSIGAQVGSAADYVVTERHKPTPVTAYDWSKLAAEGELRSSGVPFTILRPVLVYGPGAKANIALMMRIASLPLPIPFGAFRNRRSLLSIDNFVQAVIFCIESSETINRTFIVCDPKPITLAEMLATLRQAIGRAPLLVPVPPIVVKTIILGLGKRALWDRLGRELVASSDELKRLGWSPRVETIDGLRAMMEASMRAGTTEK